MAKLQNWFYKFNAWSFTKHRLWGECRLAYYFSYIGTALADGNPKIDVHELKQLKKMDSRFAIQGKLVHEIVEKWLDQNKNKEHHFSEDQAKLEFVDRIEDYRNNAKSKIVEYYNGAPINHLFFDRARENGLDQLDLFFGSIWPQIADYYYLQHEEFDNFNLDEVKIIVKIDYVCKTINNQIMIFDWKTGTESEENENDLQVNAYALWAEKKYQQRLSNIFCHLVYLTTGEIKPIPHVQEKIIEVSHLIRTEYSEMNRSYEQKDFLPNPKERNCIGCHFASACDSAIIFA